MDVELRDLRWAIHMLRARKITLLDPNTWDDKNDAYFMAEYKRQKGLATLLALCFADCDETYHHWRVFSHGSDGVRIDFEKRALLSAFAGDTHVIHGDMRYKLIKDLRTPRDFAVDDLPFLKRYPFRDEKEFRIIYADQTATALTKDFFQSSSDCRRRYLRVTQLLQCLIDQMVTAFLRSRQRHAFFNELLQDFFHRLKLVVPWGVRHAWHFSRAHLFCSKRKYHA